MQILRSESNVVFDEQAQFVRHIRWSSMGIQDVNWAAVEKLKTLRTLNLMNNHIEGPVDLTALPKGLRHLFLAENQLSGPLDFSSLPPELEIMQLIKNCFTGAVSFDSLPPSLRTLDLRWNRMLIPPLELIYNESINENGVRTSSQPIDIQLAPVPGCVLMNFKIID